MISIFTNQEECIYPIDKFGKFQVMSATTLPRRSLVTTVPSPDDDSATDSGIDQDDDSNDSEDEISNEEQLNLFVRDG